MKCLQHEFSNVNLRGSVLLNISVGAHRLLDKRVPQGFFASLRYSLRRKPSIYKLFKEDFSKSP